MINVRLSFVILPIILLINTNSFAQIGIGTSTVHSSAKFQVDAVDKGFLPPRVALYNVFDNTTIASPATGLLVYNTATAGGSPNNVLPGFYFFTGSVWNRLVNPSDITPQYRVTLGSDAGINTDGGYSVSIGRNANKNWNGSYNTAVGSFALESITSGSYNQAFGDWALQKRTSGNNATAIGAFALQNLTTGANNTALGTFAGDLIDDGAGNTVIGHNADVSATNAVNQIIIGFNAVGAGDNTVRLGNTSITNVYTSGAVNATAYNTTSDARLKTNVQLIQNAVSTVLQLQPYSYEKKSGISTSSSERMEYGFLAQDIKNVLPNLVSEGSDVDKTLSVNYTSLIPILTKALQEQQREIDELKSQLAQPHKKRKRIRNTH